MSSSGIKSLLALLVVLLAIVGMLIKFNKMPGVHLQNGPGGMKLGFGAGGQSDGGGDDDDGLDPSGKVDELRLGGFSGTPVRRLVIVNNQTFAEGEVARVEFKGKLVKLLCQTIRTNSVVMQWVDASGQVELFLDGRLPAVIQTASGTTARLSTSLNDRINAPARTAEGKLPNGQTGTDSVAVHTNVALRQVERVPGNIEIIVDGEHLLLTEESAR